MAVHLERLLKLTHGNAVYSVAFSPSADRIATASLDNTVKLWTLPDGRHMGTLRGHGDGVCFVGYLDDGRIVTASLDRVMRIWPPEGGAFTASFSGQQNYVTSAAAARSASLIAAGSFDHTVRVWDIVSGAVFVLEGHTGQVQSVALSTDGRMAVSGGDDQTVRIWNPETQSQRSVLTGHSRSIDGVALSPDDRLLASAGADGSIRLWTVDGDPVHSWDTPADHYKCITFSADSRWLAAGTTGGEVRLWDIQSAERLATLHAHRNSVYGVAFSRDGSFLATAGFDRSACVWTVTKRS